MFLYLKGHKHTVDAHLCKEPCKHLKQPEGTGRKESRGHQVHSRVRAHLTGGEGDKDRQSKDGGKAAVKTWELTFPINLFLYSPISLPIYGRSETPLPQLEQSSHLWLLSFHKKSSWMSGHHFLFDFNMTEQLGKQTLDFCESFVQLSKQCLSRDCQNNVSVWKEKYHFPFGRASTLTSILSL